MVYYLVDTENIGNQWTQVIPNLQPNDLILLFYTDSNSAQTVPFSTLGQMTATKANFKAVHCVKGTNALDFQLVTYLGFLVAKSNKHDNFIICSNDNGFDAVIVFWKNRGYNISRKLPEGLTRPAVEQPQKVASNNVCTKTYIDMLKETGITGNQAEKVASVMLHTMNLPPKGKSLQIQNQMKQNFGQKFGMVLYRQAKPVFDKVIKNGPYPQT